WRIRSVSEWMPVGSVWPRFVLFFFSSRRRHTRLVSDWSSDVCSSDLDDARKIDLLPHETLRRRGCPGRQDDDVPPANRCRVELDVARLADNGRVHSHLGKVGDQL